MAGQPAIIPEDAPGGEFTLKKWNMVIRAVNRARLLDAPGSGLSIQRTPHGTLIKTIFAGGGGYVGITATAITARSGTAAGAGVVYPVALSTSGSSGTLVTNSTSVSVWNAASTSIGSGKYCWVEPDGDGNLFVGPLDC